jgi:hypothetical protein
MSSSRLASRHSQHPWAFLGLTLCLGLTPARASAQEAAVGAREAIDEAHEATNGSAREAADQAQAVTADAKQEPTGSTREATNQAQEARDDGEQQSTGSPPLPPAQPTEREDGPPKALLVVPLTSDGRAQEPKSDEISPEGEDTKAEHNEAVPGDPWGDADGLSLITIRALLQARYVHTLAEESESSRATYVVREEYLATQGDGWNINRMLVRLSSDPSRYIGFKSVLDFAQLIDNDPEDVVKQAYAVLRPIPKRLEVVVGLFKVPFSILELDPTNRYEFADLGPSNNLLGNLGFAGRDLGVMLMGAPLPKRKRMQLSVGAFRGHAKDEHASPVGALAGRVEVTPLKSLRLGTGILQHLNAYTYDRPFNTSNKDVLPDPPDPLYPAQQHWGKGRALGADARFKKKGFMLRGEFLYGDRVDLDERYGARGFWSAWGLVAYRIEIGSVKLLPAFRAEWLDSDRDHAKRGLHRTLSGGITAIFLERVRLLFDVTHLSVQSNTPVLDQPKPLQEMPYMALDSTRFTAQLQLEL